jgi:hypothetical protein
MPLSLQRQLGINEKRKETMGKTFKTAKTKVGDDGKKWEDDLPFEMVDIRQIAKGEYHGIRLVGHIEPFMRFWVPTEAKKAYDPYKTKCKMYPSICTDFDAETEEFTGNDCLYRKAHYPKVDDDGSTSWGKLKPTKNYLIFFIDRERQEETEGIPLKKKFQQPVKFSDIKCATVPTAFAREVQNAIEMFEKKTKSDADPTDADGGFDLFFKFDSAASAEAKYNIMLGDALPLTKAERKQCELIPESIDIYPKDNEQKIADSLKRHGYTIVEPGDDPAEIAAAGSSKKVSKSTMKAGAELLDDDDDETPVKASKPVVEDDSFTDEDDDLGLSDDSEVVDDDDDDEFGEDEESTPVEKVKAKAKKAAETDDDDDEFDFDDDDFE